ncbi:MAG: amino acid ABC transporter substrate-binding protein [Paraburkholderia sp.]|nr:MAG: amino acid ABC transporter substrate-binding protein [Paraburkholderia sp.]
MHAQRHLGPAVKIGALAPLSRPGWVDAGRHLLAGLDLAVGEANENGGILGRPLELIVRDTAADPQKAIAAVDEMAHLGVVALAGEYHSVVARAAAIRADTLGMPFLCSSAVLDALTDQPSDWVARLCPVQSHGWRIYADFLLNAGHRRIAAVTQPSLYWASGTRILRDRFAEHDGALIELDASTLSPTAVCDAVVANGATALLMLTGHPETAVSIIRSVHRDQRLDTLLVGAPAGQPELPEWTALLGNEGTAIPFLRYRTEGLNPVGVRVDAALRRRLGEPPSFVAFEGYDTATVLVEALRSHGIDRALGPDLWSSLVVEGTRGTIEFSRPPQMRVWQWAWPPVEVVDRDPEQPDRFRLLHAG